MVHTRDSHRVTSLCVCRLSCSCVVLVARARLSVRVLCDPGLSRESLESRRRRGLVSWVVCGSTRAPSHHGDRSTLYKRSQTQITVTHTSLSHTRLHRYRQLQAILLHIGRLQVQRYSCRLQLQAHTRVTTHRESLMSDVCAPRLIESAQSSSSQILRAS